MKNHFKRIILSHSTAETFRYLNIQICKVKNDLATEIFTDICDYKHNLNKIFDNRLI